MAVVSITTAWNEAAAFVKREARLLFPLAFMLIALPVAVMEAFTPEPPAPGAMPEGGVWMLLFPLTALLGMVGNLAISWMALVPGVSVGEAIARGLKRFLAMLGAAVLVGIGGIILFMIAAIVVTALVPGAMADAAAGQQTPALAMAVVLTMLIGLPFFLFFAARLILMTPVAAAEDVGPLGIIRRSWRLTRGQTIKLILFVLLVGIAVGVLSVAVQSVAGVIFTLLAGPPEPGSTSRLLSLLVMAALNTVVVAYFTSLIARLYAQLADRTDAPSAIGV